MPALYLPLPTFTSTHLLYIPPSPFSSYISDNIPIHTMHPNHFTLSLSIIPIHYAAIKLHYIMPSETARDALVHYNNTWFSNCGYRLSTVYRGRAGDGHTGRRVSAGRTARSRRPARATRRLADIRQTVFSPLAASPPRTGPRLGRAAAPDCVGRSRRFLHERRAALAPDFFAKKTLRSFLEKSEKRLEIAKNRLRTETFLQFGQNDSKLKGQNRLRPCDRPSRRKTAR